MRILEVLNLTKDGTTNVWQTLLCGTHKHLPRRTCLLVRRLDKGGFTVLLALCLADLSYTDTNVYKKYLTVLPI